MKNFKLTFFALAGALALASCSEDDNATSVNSDLAGTFKLTSFVVPQAQDLDNNGSSSANLVSETDCYADSQIVFNSNGTYQQTYSHSILASTGLTLTCSSETSTGTYTQNGNQVTTTSSTGTTAQFTFNSSAHTLTQTQSNGQYPGFTAQVLAMLTGNLTLTFTKTENGNSANAEAVGNYDLTAFVVPIAQNLNGDANSSTNLVTESSCYGESNLTLNSNGTFDQTYTYSVLSTGGLTLECQTQVTSGTWTRSGNTITTTTTGSAAISTQYMFNATAHTLSQTVQNGAYPGLSTATQLLVSLSGTLNLTYTRNN